MAGRGRDWRLLGGSDPTPGEPDTLDGIAAEFEAYADAADGISSELGLAAHDVGGSSWRGTAWAAFLGAVGPVPGLVAEQSTAFTEVAQLLRAWALVLTDLQTEADDLLRQAEEAEAAQSAAEAQLPGARSARSTAYRALSNARDGDDQRATTSAFRNWDRADDRVTRLEAERDAATHDLALLVEEASELASTHRTTAATYANAVRGAALPALDLLPFATAVAVEALEDRLGGTELGGTDGVVSPTELAAILVQVTEEISPFGGLEDDQLAAYTRLLASVAAHPDLAGDVLAGLGDDIPYVLLGVHDLGQDASDPERYADLAEQLIRLIQVGSGTTAGREALIQQVYGLSYYTSVVLLAIADLDPDVVAAAATAVIASNWSAGQFFWDNPYFPALQGSHTLVALLALVDQPDAVRAFFDGPGAEDRMADLLDLAPYPMVDAAVLEVLVSALVDGTGEGARLAGALIHAVAEHGTGDLNIHLALVTLLAPHLPDVVDDIDDEVPLDRDVWQQFLNHLLDDVPAAMAGEIALVIIGAAVLDAASAEWPLDGEYNNVLRNEMADWVGPLQEALTAEALSVEEAQAAINSAFDQGAGIVSTVVGILTPDPTGVLAKAAVKEVTGRVIGFVGDRLAEAVSPADFDVPSIHEQASAITNVVLEEIVGNPEIRTELDDRDDLYLVPEGSVPDGVPSNRVVPIGDGLVAVLEEQFVDTLRNDIRDALGAGL